jgi:hypothetical protein
MKKPSKQMVAALEKGSAIDFILRSGGIFISEKRPLNFYERKWE